MISITEKEFRQLVDYVYANYGINLREKKALVEGRLQNILTQNNLDTFSDYYKYVVTDKTGEAATTLINKLTTNHTFFLREAEHFYFFRDKILPTLTSSVRNRDLRIWSAGCSSGEEPYTLAMIISDFLGPEKPLWDSKILATDISKKVLQSASDAVYMNDQISSIPDGWKRSYFRKLDEGRSIVSDRIRNEVIFRTFNLNNPTFPFKNKFHVIFCRNVMIYFDMQSKRSLVSRFYDNIEPGGYLFIGHSESLSHDETRFKYVMPAVYRKE